MKNSIKTLLFSLIVSLSLNAIDMFFHYLTNTAVHLGYVAVKLTIIFLSVYLIAQFININNKEGIITSIFGPFMFYLYYLFAYPTLDRTVFRLDEQFYFLFAHIIMMFVAYFSAYWFIVKQNLKKICFFISSVTSLLALNLLYFMTLLNIKGIPDYEAVNMIVFIDALKILIILTIVIGLVTLLFYKNKFKGVIAGLISAILGFIFLNNLNVGLFYPIYSFIMVNIVFYFIKISMRI